MKQTDCQKTLHLLQEAGSGGIHSFDLNHLVGTTRIAARILDLKAQGYGITSIPEKRGDSHGCRYFLISSSNVKPQTSKKPVKEQPKKPIRYEYVGNTCIPIYQ